LSAMPRIDGAPRRERILLVGDIPSPIDPPARCRFASRCFRPIDTCWHSVPPLEPLGASTAACFNPVPPGAQHSAHTKGGE
jgi:oligopeptide/dipeptide ABC transporter ATP-binding protein